MSLSAASFSTRVASQIMSNVLVVGGGLTAGVTSSLLASYSKDGGKVNLSIWDKANGCGGRMSTSRSPNNPECTADLGAQYITATPSYQVEHKIFYDELKSHGLIAPLSTKIIGRKESEPGTIDFVMPKGSSSIVKHFFKKSGTKIQFGQFIETIRLSDNRWTVETKEGRKEEFDCLVLTMPVPQILHVAREVLKEKPDLKRQLESVEYSSRYGLALFYDEDKSDVVNLDENVSAKYLTDHPIFRFVSLDNVKRSGKIGGPTSVIFHTSVPFGVKRVEATPDELKPELLSHAEKLFPNWPKPSHVKCQKWRYSQVSTTFPNGPGFVVLHEDPLLLAGGDAFVHSNFDGCVASAQKINNILAAKLQL